jgi:hypothetical protein
MKIAVANDHRGVSAVEQVKAIVAQLNHETLDFSSTTEQPVVIPTWLLSPLPSFPPGQADRANPHLRHRHRHVYLQQGQGVRAALCYDNSMRISATTTPMSCAFPAISSAPACCAHRRNLADHRLFGGRQLRRVHKIQAIEQGKDPRNLNE